MNKTRFQILNFPLPVALLCCSFSEADVARLNILGKLWCFYSFYCGINFKRRSLGRADWSCPGVMLLNCSGLHKGTSERWCLEQPWDMGTHGRPVCRATKSWMLKMWWLDKSPHFIPPNRDKATGPGMRPSYPRYFPFHIFICTTEIWMLSSSLKNCKRKFEWIPAWQQGTGKDWDNSGLWFFFFALAGSKLS